ncbi:PATL2 [Linum perenne]
MAPATIGAANPTVFSESSKIPLRSFDGLRSSSKHFNVFSIPSSRRRPFFIKVVSTPVKTPGTEDQSSDVSTEVNILPVEKANEELVTLATAATAATEVSIWGIPLLKDDRSDVVLLKSLRARDFKIKEALTTLKSPIR